MCPLNVAPSTLYMYMKVWVVCVRGYNLFNAHHAPITMVVICLACMRLPARNGLVNEVEFLGLISQKW